MRGIIVAVASSLLVACGGSDPGGFGGGAPEVKASSTATPSPAMSSPSEDDAQAPPDAGATQPAKVGGNGQDASPDAGGGNVGDPDPKPHESDAGPAPVEAAAPKPTYPVRCVTSTGTFTCDGTTTGGFGYALSWNPGGGPPVLCGDQGAEPCGAGDACQVSDSSATIDGRCQ